MNKPKIIVVGVVLVVCGLIAWRFIGGESDVVVPKEGSKKAPIEALEKFAEIHQELEAKEATLIEAFDEAGGERSTEWKDFSVEFAKAVRALPMAFVDDLQYEDSDSKNKVVEKVIVHNQQLLFLWREMNSSLAGKPAQVELAKTELEKAKAAVKELVYADQ